MSKAIKVATDPNSPVYPAEWIIRDGSVALRYYTETQKVVIVGGHTYAFIPQFNVSMCWVALEDAQRVMAQRASCESCPGGGRPRTVFYPANKDSVDRWEGKLK